MRTVEILSWKKDRNECGYRLNLINHPDVFVQEHGTTFKVDDSMSEVHISIIEYSDEYDHSKSPSEVIGKDKTHVEKCIIRGSKDLMKSFQKQMGYSSSLHDATDIQKNNDLCSTIESLTHSVSMLEYEIDKLKKE